MSEATRIRSLMEKNLDQPASETITFASTGQVVLQTGDIIRREHLTAFNKTVQDELSAIEMRSAAERDRRISALSAESSQTGREEEARQAELQEAIDARVLSIEERYEGERDG